MTRTAARRVFQLGTVLLPLVLVAQTAVAGARPSQGDEQPWCKPGTWHDGATKGWGPWLRTDAAIGLYNAGLWAVGTGAVHFAADPPSDSRWSERNSFDEDLRDGLRLGSSSARSSARTASDLLLVSAVAAPLGLGLWRSWRDCDAMAEVASDWAESMTLVALLTESTKAIVGRERPCGGPGCRDGISRKSFFSGHASLSAAGAGLVCSQSIRRRLFGPGRFAAAAPCALGAAWALATGVMRVAGDEHWASDVLTAWTVGALVGYFDVPGPFDLLRFRIRGEHGGTAAEGIVLPYAGRQQAGVRLDVRF